MRHALFIGFERPGGCLSRKTDRAESGFAPPLAANRRPRDSLGDGAYPGRTGRNPTSPPERAPGHAVRRARRSTAPAASSASCRLRRHTDRTVGNAADGRIGALPCKRNDRPPVWREGRGADRTPQAGHRGIK